MGRLKQQLLRIILASILLVTGILINTDNTTLELAIFLASYLIAGGQVLIKAARSVIGGDALNENFLMAIATIGAFFIGEYVEGVAVMLFYLVGEMMQNYAVDKSRRSIADLMDIRPDYAIVKSGNDLIRTDPDEVAVGDIIVVSAGERVPLDGLVIEGNCMLDTSALTGEHVPREVFAGGEVLSGCINLNGLLSIEVTKVYEESTVSKILDLVENATSKKAKMENFITKFAKYYTPVVAILAALISVCPPLLVRGATFADWLYRGLTFLVISCPCALVISIPLGFFGGIGGASGKGILIKGSNYLESLSKLDTVVFDKTGTLTKGVFEVQEIRSYSMDPGDLLDYAAHAESYSNHPISFSLQKAYGKQIGKSRISGFEENAGHGVKCLVDGKTVLAGNRKLMATMGINCPDEEHIGTLVFVAVDGSCCGSIIIADEVKEDSKEAIATLKSIGIKKTVMLTGDAKNVGENVADLLGIDIAFTELLPEGKVEILERLLAEQGQTAALAFVGDGLNDAPVLARADVGIAMGGLGSDAAIEAADVVIMTDEPSKITASIKIAKKTMGIVKQNVVFSLVVKFAVLALATLGLASMWAGVLADVGVTVIAVLNSMRALSTKNI
ncbi:MAG: cadmium-translocating P-type ATPase [Eubacteriaceae bacterium]|nr:cadmium-translocating P-type ATPase [Eubacteriaceae bacterium]